MNERKHTIFGETKTTTEWVAISKEKRMNRKTLSQRFLAHPSNKEFWLHAPLGTGKAKEEKKYTSSEKTMTINEWADYHGVPDDMASRNSYRTKVGRRMSKLGWSEQDAFDETKGYKPRRPRIKSKEIEDAQKEMDEILDDPKLLFSDDADKRIKELQSIIYGTT